MQTPAKSIITPKNNSDVSAETVSYPSRPLSYNIMSVLQLPDNTVIDWHLPFVGNTAAVSAVLDTDTGCFAFGSEGVEVYFCGHFSEEGFGLKDDFRKREHVERGRGVGCLEGKRKEGKCSTDSTAF